jgi:hypothetical protein
MSTSIPGRGLLLQLLGHGGSSGTLSPPGECAAATGATGPHPETTHGRSFSGGARGTIQQGDPSLLPPPQLDGLVDLLTAALRQGHAWGLTAEKVSAFVQLVKVTHHAAVSGKMTLDGSFRFCYGTLLRHSLERCDQAARARARAESRGHLW